MRRWLWGLAAVLLVAASIFAWPFVRFAYLWHFYGPPALEKLPASAPTFTLRYGTAPKQFADLRMPAGRGPFPVAVVVHGGCYTQEFGSSRGTAGLADALTKRGIATLNVQYRITGDPGGGWPGTIRDVGAAIDSLRDLARHYPLNLDQLVVAGHSAGAQLALWSAVRSKLSPVSEIAVPDPLLPKAVVAIDGPATLAEFVGEDASQCGKPVIVPFMGGTPRQFPDRYRDASAQDHLPLGIHQYVVQAAFADLMQPYVDRARRSGDTVTVYRPKDGKHFSIINPTQPMGQGTIALIQQAVRNLPN